MAAFIVEAHQRALSRRRPLVEFLPYGGSNPRRPSHGRASAFAISIADLSMSATARFDAIAANPAGLCEEVHLNLAYRWFCRLGLDGKVPDHSTFSKNRHGRFRR